MRKLFTREILIGFILILSLAILFVGIDFLKGINVFKSSNMYYVSFEDVSGLTEASPVTLNGMKVGQVTDILYDYDNPGNILVEVNLDSQIKVTKGSRISMSSSMLGTASLALQMSPGTEYLAEGERIVGSKASDLMSEISTDIMPEVVKILPRLNNILASVDSVMANPALDEMVTRLDAISRNIEITTAKLAAVSGHVGPVVSNAEEITADLRTVSADLKEISAELKKMPVAETMDNVKVTTDNLADITTKLNGTNSTLGLLLNDDGLYNRIDSTILSLDSIFIDLKAHPKKYVQFKLF